MTGKMTEVSPLKVPIAFIIFNRPETTRRVFEQIAKVRPIRLHIIADGPRSDVPEDSNRCRQARQIIEEINWDCDVTFDYSETNMGIKERISSGLNGLFSNVKSAIILEDDCLPNRSFFYYCEQLLSRFENDPRVMMISGTNFSGNIKPNTYSYYYSIFPLIWGWATWASSWEHFDGSMRLWPEVRDRGLLAGLFPNPRHRRYWDKRLQLTYEGRLDTWDYCWILACWLNRALTTIPSGNLVGNIGFGSQATHTVGSHSPWMDMHTQDLAFPLVHPPYLIPDAVADKNTQEKVFREHMLAPIKKRLKLWLQKIETR